jgi:hypothetical protein
MKESSKTLFNLKNKTKIIFINDRRSYEFMKIVKNNIPITPKFWKNVLGYF